MAATTNETCQTHCAHNNTYLLYRSCRGASEQRLQIWFRFTVHLFVPFWLRLHMISLTTRLKKTRFPLVFREMSFANGECNCFDCLEKLLRLFVERGL